MGGEGVTDSGKPTLLLDEAQEFKRDINLRTGTSRRSAVDLQRSNQPQNRGKWTSNGAASVRRLVRDGVDSPLAKLFVHAAVIPTSKDDCPDRARSATEAFLYRRLETLTETAGRFRLNAELPIPFDGWGRMEVDLLCDSSRIAIELDGGQHLGDADAYRRDRRKDALLQENGYRVLRFLAEDVGKRLDQVLDAILRALSRQNGKI